MKRLVSVFGWIVSTFIACAAFAQEHAANAADGSPSNKAALAIAAGLGIALASLGGALAQGRAAASALEGIARNPEAAGKVMTPMIIALALIESLVIYSLVIAFLLYGKI